jgi:hypothetical protein
MGAMRSVRLSPRVARHIARVLDESTFATLLVNAITRLRDGADTYETHVILSELERTVILRVLERAPVPAHPTWMSKAIETLMQRLEDT